MGRFVKLKLERSSCQHQSLSFKDKRKEKRPTTLFVVKPLARVGPTAPRIVWIQKPCPKGGENAILQRGNERDSESCQSMRAYFLLLLLLFSSHCDTALFFFVNETAFVVFLTYCFLLLNVLLEYCVGIQILRHSFKAFSCAFKRLVAMTSLYVILRCVSYFSTLWTKSNVLGLACCALTLSLTNQCHAIYIILLWAMTHCMVNS